MFGQSKSTVSKVFAISWESTTDGQCGLFVADTDIVTVTEQGFDLPIGEISQQLTAFGANATKHIEKEYGCKIKVNNISLLHQQ